MSSKLSTRSSPGYWPPWCYDAPTANVPNYVDEKPSTIIAAVLYATTIYGEGFRVSESFSCVYNATTKEYFGESLNVGVNVELEISAHPTEPLYRPSLSLWDADAYLAGVLWPWIQIPPGPPFDSRMLTLFAGPPGSKQTIHLLA